MVYKPLWSCNTDLAAVWPAPLSGGFGPSHLSSAPRLVAGLGPRHELRVAQISEAQISAAAIWYFPELITN